MPSDLWASHPPPMSWQLSSCCPDLPWGCGSLLLSVFLLISPTEVTHGSSHLMNLTKVSTTSRLTGVSRKFHHTIHLTHILRRRFTVAHAKRYRDMYGLALALQQKYAWVAALVQMIIIAQELEGATPDQSATGTKTWLTRLKAKVSLTLR